MYISTTNLLEQRRLPAYSFDSRMKLKDRDLNGIIKELQDVLAGIIPDNIEVAISLADSELKIMTDPLKLKGAFLNLIENAADALSPGGLLKVSTSRIRFTNGTECSSEYASGGCALVTISDTGTGMNEYTKERIFEPFFTTKPGKDKGLGCTLAQRVIECHNGRITVESTINRGTKVRVYLPLIKDDRIREVPIPLPSSFGMKRAAAKMRRSF
ncbi:MAG: ATP-binding protein [Syntrophorhabdaceae bacterium]